MPYYAEHVQELKRDLAAAIPTDELRRLHEKRADAPFGAPRKHAEVPRSAGERHLG